MTEDLALEQRLRNGRAVDGDEGLVAPRAHLVKRARYHFLAGAAFSGDENGNAARRGLSDEPVDVLHDRRAADQATELPALGEIAREPQQLLAIAHALDRLLENHLEPGEVDRLGEVVVSALAHRLGRVLDRAVAGEQDEHGVRQIFADRAHQLDAGRAGHHQIGKNDVRRELPADGQRVPRVGGGAALISPTGDEFGESGPRGILVVHDEDSVRCHGVFASAEPDPRQAASPQTPGRQEETMRGPCRRPKNHVTS